MSLNWDETLVVVGGAGWLRARGVRLWVRDVPEAAWCGRSRKGSVRP